jgi:hypothetical protein
VPPVRPGIQLRPADVIRQAFGDAGAVRTVVLVEGVSDRVALEATAARTGRVLRSAGVAVVAMGGATNVGRFLEAFGPPGLGLEVAGLCDEQEVGHVLRGLRRAGIRGDLGRSDLAAHGFFVCVADLEDELIRALGTDRVEDVVAAAGELGSFRTLQKQVAQRGRGTEAQLHRFLGSGSGRKIRYARLLVEALDADAIPRPLVATVDRAFDRA